MPNGTYERALSGLADSAAQNLNIALRLLGDHVRDVMEIHRSRSLAGEGPDADAQAAEVIAAVRRDVIARLDAIEAAVRDGRL